MDEKISYGGERCMIMMASREHLGYVLVFEQFGEGRAAFKRFKEGTNDYLDRNNS
jgi:hypothetical protein